MRSSQRAASIAPRGSPSRTMPAGPMCSFTVRQRSEWWPCGRSFPSRERTDRYADAALNAAKTRTTSHYLYVPERAAAETIRGGIRAGGLRAKRVGTQHVMEEDDLDAVTERDPQLPLPKEGRRTRDGKPMPNVVRIIRLSRRGH